MGIKLIKLTGLSVAFLGMTSALPSYAGYEIKLSETDSITFGGYIKVDARNVNGTIPYRDYWIGSGTVSQHDVSQFRINARETRINTKYVHGDVSGFIEFDLYGGNSDVGNEVISNSYAPRLRHAFIKYGDWLAGQTWSTFMNTSAIPETADFGGTLVGEAFIRQGQIRYSAYGFQFALENPETVSTSKDKNDKYPDVVLKYTLKDDWGNVSLAALGRHLDDASGVEESTLGLSLAGRIKTFGKDDFRFQYHWGKLGRYVGVTLAKDIVNGKVEKSTAYTLAYRHYWDDTLRSSLFYARGETKYTDAERSQYGVNLFKNLTKKLSVGIEYGRYEVLDVGKPHGDSDYVQFSAKYVL